jgi:dihydrodipicolinate synthase/N-acetylneuraminate lyase
MEGAEAILAAGKGGKTALVIGVQTHGGDMGRPPDYARHAAKNGADAIVSLPPEKADDNAMLEYYKTIGKATDLPLFVQSTGDMSVDLIVRMFKEIPTMRVVKDEAGNPLQRVAEIRERTGGKLNVFSGNGVRTMITEMERGFMGHCPTTGMSDIYAQAFDLWHAGKKARRVRYVRARARLRQHPQCGFLRAHRARRLQGRHHHASDDAEAEAAAGSRREGGQPRRAPLDEAGKREIREALNTYLKPYLKG